jgi:starch-binding outer membrane protein, SusD/RagB family
MKIANKIYFGLMILGFVGITGCNKFLDREPLSDVTQESYFNSEADLAAYTLARYSFPTHDGWGPGTHSFDNHTDNQATSSSATRWIPGEWRVPQSGGSWDFTSIRQVNYFLEVALPRWKENKITGNAGNITHYIGEAYFLRAYEYFKKVQAFGDFPIIKSTLPDDQASLTEASKRRPRNEVSRFILADLDSAIQLLSATPPGGKNRISKNAALLFKSRVGLHEGSWLTYHKGTAQVPGGQNWPGTGKVENFNINIDAEIDFFLAQAMDAASQVADAVGLVNNAPDDNGFNSSSNPYFKMFADVSLESYGEVLLWRAYDPNKGISHNVSHYINRNGGNTGYTRSFVDNFLMQNGLPVYAPGSGYRGDDSVHLVKENRDRRLQLFMKMPGEVRVTDVKNGDGSSILEGYPDIIGLPETRYVTGYAIKKGLSYINDHGEGSKGVTGSIVFRAVEAYLNYIEASYLKNGSLDSKSDQYWKAIRTRAGIDPDYQKTIAATIMTEEAKNDFAAYSKGQLLTDATLYNIRRERRSELIAEGMRYSDLKRWRALDQLKSNPYMVEGFKLWGPMQNWYKEANGASKLIEAETPGKTANVSKRSESNYLRPYRVNLSASNLAKEGYKWTPAHYLEPIAIQHFQITAGNPADLGTSVLYQNPGWPTVANQGAIE